jgi:hypothetical protein
MKYAYLLQLSNMVTFWGMIATALYAANGSASRAAVASYTQSNSYMVQLVVVALLSPVLQFFFGPSFHTVVNTLVSGMEQPSFAAAYAAFTLVTIATSFGLVALVAGLAFNNVLTALFAPIVDEEPEQQVSTAK